jgi:hypothetical protein
MDCLTCRDLKQRYEKCLADYDASRSSASYGVSNQFAAGKNVDMERARFEWEEHRSVCISAPDSVARLPKRVLPYRKTQLVA